MSSLLGKFKTEVDTTVIANGDSIASYLVDAAGTLLTSTLVGGTQQSLDVNVTQSALPAGAATEATSASILAELAALTNVDGTAWSAGSTGSMPLAVRQDATGPLTGVDDGDFSPLQVDANGNLKISGTIVITDAAEHAEDSAASSGDMGIFSLLVRQDTLATSTSTDGDYGAFKSNALGELYVHDTDVKAQLVSANSTLTNIKSDTASIVTNTSSSASSLAALSKAEDAAHSSGDQGIQALAVRKDASGSNVSADGDYASLIQWTEGSLKVVDIANASMLQQRISVANTATALPASPLATRRSIMVQNAGAASIWVGSATVTASGATAGIEVPKGGFIELEVGPAVAVYAISAGTVAANVLELA